MNVHYAQYTIAMSDYNGKISTELPKRRNWHHQGYKFNQVRFNRLQSGSDKATLNVLRRASIDPRHQRPKTVSKVENFYGTSKEYTPPTPLHNEKGYAVHASFFPHTVLEDTETKGSQAVLSDIVVFHTTDKSATCYHDEVVARNSCNKKKKFKGRKSGCVDIVFIGHVDPVVDPMDITIESSLLLNRERSLRDIAHMKSALLRCFAGPHQRQTSITTFSSASSTSTEESSITTILSSGKEFEIDERQPNPRRPLVRIPSLPCRRVEQNNDTTEKISNFFKDSHSTHVGTVRTEVIPDEEKMNYCAIHHDRSESSMLRLPPSPSLNRRKDRTRYDQYCENDDDVMSDENADPCSIEYKAPLKDTSQRCATNGIDLTSHVKEPMHATCRLHYDCSQKNEFWGEKLSRWSSVEKLSKPPFPLDNPARKVRNTMKCQLETAENPKANHILASFPSKEKTTVNLHGGIVMNALSYKEDKTKNMPLTPPIRTKDHVEDTKPCGSTANCDDHISSPSFRSPRKMSRQMKKKNNMNKKNKKQQKHFKQMDRKSKSLIDEMNEVIVGMRLSPNSQHQQEVVLPSPRPSMNYLRCNESIEDKAKMSPVSECVSSLRRILYRIPEESAMVASSDFTSTSEPDGQALQKAEYELDVIGMTLDMIRRRRRKRQKRRQQISYEHTKQALRSSKQNLEEKKLIQSVEVAKSFVRVAQKYVENEKFYEAYLQFIDALQYCVKQDISKKNPTRLDIHKGLKFIHDTVLIASLSLRDNILFALERRAEQELRHTGSIDQAVITLKSALELRKTMLESMLLSATKGEGKPNISSTSTSTTNAGKEITAIMEEKFDPHPLNIPDLVISTTSRLLLMLSRCFTYQGKIKCAQRARRDAETLFQSSRVAL